MIIIISFAVILYTGFSEETLFRGIVFNYCILKCEKSNKGLIKAALISSALFGIIHVRNIFSVKINSIIVLQFLVKSLQAGIGGFTFCAFYIKTNNLFWISIYHCLFDLPILIIFINGEKFNYLNGEKESLIALSIFSIF